MDISSGSSYPASGLSNFAPHPFIIDDIECASMEGFLQSLKFKDENMQIEICKKVGRQAKRAGAKKIGKKNKLYIGEENLIKGIQLNIKNY
jgi:bacteriophage protein GP30.3